MGSDNMLTFPLKLVLPTPDEPIMTNFTVFTVVSMSVVESQQRTAVRASSAITDNKFKTGLDLCKYNKFKKYLSKTKTATYLWSVESMLTSTSETFQTHQENGLDVFLNVHQGRVLVTCHEHNLSLFVQKLMIFFRHISSLSRKHVRISEGVLARSLSTNPREKSSPVSTGLLNDFHAFRIPSRQQDGRHGPQEMATHMTSSLLIQINSL